MSKDFSQLIRYNLHDAEPAILHFRIRPAGYTGHDRVLLAVTPAPSGARRAGALAPAVLFAMLPGFIRERLGGPEDALLPLGKDCSPPASRTPPQISRF
jgi:hypothetical protein